MTTLNVWDTNRRPVLYPTGPAQASRRPDFRTTRTYVPKSLPLPEAIDAGPCHYFCGASGGDTWAGCAIYITKKLSYNLLMLGAIVGDVIGSPFEHANVKSTSFRLFDRGSQCTDDSILTVATADVLLHRGDYTATYHDYFRRFPNAGYGGSFVVWANRRECRPYGSWGNGSAMRVSPVAWACDTLDQVLAEAERSAGVTHDHPEGVRGAAAVAGAVFLARTECDRSRVRDFIIDGCGYPLDRTIDQIRPSYGFDVSCKGTVPVAVQAFLESRDFEGAVRLAVSVGGDSDTIACMAGAIAHAFYGGVPRRLLDPVLDVYLSPDLAETALAFCKRFHVPMGT